MEKPAQFSVKTNRYRVTAPIVLPRGVSIWAEKGATIVAASALGSIFTTTAVAGSGLIRQSICGLTLDGNGIASDGFHLRFVRGVVALIETTVKNCQRYPYRLGDTGAPNGSYEVVLDRFAVDRDPSFGAAPAGSVGIYFDNAGDSQIGQGIISGVKKATDGTVYDSKFREVHAWNTELHGKMDVCFDIKGGENEYFMCQADGPFAIAAFRVAGTKQIIVGPSINYGSILGVDNEAYAILLQPGSTGAIIGPTIKGQPSARLLTDVGGDLSGFDVVGLHSSHCVLTTRLRAIKGQLFGGTNTFRAPADIQMESGSLDGVTIPASGFGILASANGNAAAALRRRSTDGNILNFWRDTVNVGSVSVTSTTTAYNTASDQRLKERQRIMPFEEASKIVALIEIHEFRWKSTGDVDYGAFAQELFEIYPSAVSPGQGNPGDEGFVPWAVDYSKLVAPLLRTVQSLDHRLTQVEMAAGIGNAAKHHPPHQSG